jgi:hypothetical protein
LYLLGYRTAYLDEAAEDWSPCRIIDVVGLDVALQRLKWIGFPESQLSSDLYEEHIAVEQLTWSLSVRDMIR